MAWRQSPDGSEQHLTRAAAAARTRTTAKLGYSVVMIIPTGVITAGVIVPEADNLSVEVKVNPQDIDQLQLNQKAILRFSAFNIRTTPEIEGTVTRISADTSTDQRTGQSYYTIRIAMPAEQIERLGDVKLLPGMPVEAFIQTRDRTMLSYLMKPLHDQVLRAFREK